MTTPRYLLHIYSNLQTLRDNIFLINQFAFNNSLTIVIEEGKALINADTFFNSNDKNITLSFSPVWDITNKAKSFVTGYGLSVDESEDLDINWISQYFIHMLSHICPSENIHYKTASLYERYGQIVANNFIYPQMIVATYQKQKNPDNYALQTEPEFYDKINQCLLTGHEKAIELIDIQHNLNIIHPNYLTPIHYLLSQTEMHNQDLSVVLPLIKKLHHHGFELYGNVSQSQEENKLIQARLNEPILTHAFKCQVHVDVLIYLIQNKPKEQAITPYFLENFLLHRSTYTYQEKLKLLDGIEEIENQHYDYYKLLNTLKLTDSPHYEKVEALYLKQKTLNQTLIHQNKKLQKI